MNRNTAARIAGASLLLSTGSAAADEKVDRFYAYAYDLKTNAYLYTEVHAQKIVDEKWVSGTIRYYGPDGKEMGKKTLDFSQDPNIPIYRFDLPAEGYSEGITKVGDTVTLVKTSGKGAGEKTATVQRKAPIAADSGFHNFLVANFADLMAGKTVPFTFIAAGNLDSYKFRAMKTADETWEGVKAVHIHVEASSLLRLVAPSLELTYDPVKKTLLEYRGISNVHDPKSGKAYTARISFYPEPPADAPKPLPPLE